MAKSYFEQLQAEEEVKQQPTVRWEPVQPRGERGRPGSGGWEPIVSASPPSTDDDWEPVGNVAPRTVAASAERKYGSYLEQLDAEETARHGPRHPPGYRPPVPDPPGYRRAAAGTTTAPAPDAPITRNDITQHRLWMRDNGVASYASMPAAQVEQQIRMKRRIAAASALKTAAGDAPPATKKYGSYLEQLDAEEAARHQQARDDQRAQAGAIGNAVASSRSDIVKAMHGYESAKTPEPASGSGSGMTLADLVVRGSTLGASPEERPNLAERGAKQFGNALILEDIEQARPSTTMARGVGTFEEAAKATEGLDDAPWYRKVASLPSLWWGLTKGYYGGKGRQYEAELRANRGDVTLDVPEAETVGEKVTDAGAGLAAFLARMIVAKKLTPAEVPAALRPAVMFEMESQSRGGIPGEGFVMGGAFGAIQGVPTKTLRGEGAKLLAESGLFGGATAAQGGDAVDVMIAAAIPPALKGAGMARADFAKRMRAAKSPEEVAAVIRDANFFSENHREAQQFVANADVQTLKAVRRRFEGRTEANAVAMRNLIDAKLRGENITAPPKPERPSPDKQAISKPGEQIPGAGAEPPATRAASPRPTETTVTPIDRPAAPPTPQPAELASPPDKQGDRGSENVMPTPSAPTRPVGVDATKLAADVTRAGQTGPAGLSVTIAPRAGGGKMFTITSNVKGLRPRLRRAGAKQVKETGEWVIARSNVDKLREYVGVREGSLTIGGSDATQTAPGREILPGDRRGPAGQQAPDQAGGPGEAAGLQGPARTDLQVRRRPVSKAEVERRLIKHATENLGLREAGFDAEQLEAMRQGRGENFEFSTAFAGPLPTDLKTALEGKTHLLSTLKANQKGGRAEDTISDMGLDAFVSALEQVKGSQLNKALELSRGAVHVDPAAAFYARLHDAYPRKDAGLKLQTLKRPGKQLNAGDTLTIFGDRYEVDIDGGAKVLFDRDGEAVTYLDALDDMPIDTGSVRQAARDTGAAGGQLTMGGEAEGRATVGGTASMFGDLEPERAAGGAITEADRKAMRQEMARQSEQEWKKRRPDESEEDYRIRMKWTRDEVAAATGDLFGREPGPTRYNAARRQDDARTPGAPEESPARAGRAGRQAADEQRAGPEAPRQAQAERQQAPATQEIVTPREPSDEPLVEAELDTDPLPEPAPRPRYLAATTPELHTLTGRELQREAHRIGITNLQGKPKRALIRAIEERTGVLEDRLNDPASEPTPFDRHQAGFAQAAAIHSLASIPAGVVEGSKKLIDWWSKPLTGVVEDQGGRAGKQIAALSRKANDEARRITGRLSPRLVRIQHAAAGKSWASRRAVRALARIEWVPGKDYGFSRFQGSVEERIPLDDLSPVARQIVQDYRSLVRKTGLMAEQKGVLVVDRPNMETVQTGRRSTIFGSEPVTETRRVRPGQGDVNLFGEPQTAYVPFKASRDGALMLRRATSELWDIMRTGEGSKAYQALARALADANGITESVALRELNAMADRALTRRAAFETSRVFKRFPTHLRVHGEVIELLHSEPYRAATELVRTSAMRLGFIDAFGQDVPQRGEPSLPEQMLEHFVRQGGRRKDAEDLFRTLHGMPIHERYIDPGTPLHEASRWVNALLGLVRTGLLTRAAIPNAPESFAKVPAFAGLGRYFRGWAYLMRYPRSATIETARHGARTVEVMRLTIDPKHKREGVVRLARDVGLRLVGHIPVNELNELHAAVTGILMAADLKAGRGTVFDRVRLEAMGFEPREVDAMMSGRGTRDQYNAIITRLPEVTAGSTSTASERSRAASSPAYRFAVSFDSFSQFTTDRVARVNRKLIDALKNAHNDPKKAGAALTMAAQFYAGSTASGVVALLLRALAVGGVAGLLIKLNEAEDDPGEFMAESLRYTLLGGPTEAVWRAVSDDRRPWYESAMGVSLPVSLIREIVELSEGEGRYRDRSWSERSLRFLESHVTVSRPVRTWAAVLGLTQDDPEMDAAISAYWRWRFENAPPGSFKGEMSDAHRKFRRHMRRAVEAMRDGRDPAEHLQQALGVDGKGVKNVKASLRGKRLLKGPGMNEETIEALKAKLPAWAFEKLENHDALLDAWAEAVGELDANP